MSLPSRVYARRTYAAGVTIHSMWHKLISLKRHEKDRNKNMPTLRQKVIHNHFCWRAVPLSFLILIPSFILRFAARDSVPERDWQLQHLPKLFTAASKNV